jgi:shikimate kinase
MMGCGKSAIGKMLATTLGIEFVDADTEIEAAAGRSIAEIFEDFGEPEFRRLEERVIERLLGEGTRIIALGGGAFINEKTRNNIVHEGLSIWIQADIDILFERVMRKPGKRPLLATDNPKQTLSDLMAKREPIYAKAELHVQSVPGTKSEMRDVLIRAIDQHLAEQSTMEIQ